MSVRNLSFDSAAYSMDAVQRAIYRFSDRLSCDLSQGEDTITVTVHLADGVGNPDSIIADFRNEVLDQTLRERIRDETAGVRNLVLALAFSKTGLVEADV